MSVDGRLGLVVHASHEAGFKVGGIGAVLDGVLSSTAYNRAVERTILVGQIETADEMAMERLVAAKNRLTLRYSSWHRIEEVDAALALELRRIEDRYMVHLFYGTRLFGSSGEDYAHEVLLVDARWADIELANGFKASLWSIYRIESDQFEWHDEFDMAIKAAPPAYEALGVLSEHIEGGFLVSHEWMGMPLAFCAQMDAGRGWKLVYYAHEMPTARILVEDHSGHDTRFYNALHQAELAGFSMDQVFGDRSDFFKHVLIKLVTRFDAILAVGRWVEKELRFLGGELIRANIDLVYNGVPFREIDMAQRSASSDRLKQYCQNLLGYWPDHVFTHVTRMVVSKGLWRDIAVLQHLDSLMSQDGSRAVLFMLTTSVAAGRPPAQVYRWEEGYGWPVVHHVDTGDLVGHEAPLYAGIEAFNARSRAIKIVFVNQFGWSRELCGLKMPAESAFTDVRQGTDLEFGQSIYEPFGIAQVEPLAFGAMSVVSNVCGCVGFITEAARECGLQHFPSLIQADYTSLPSRLQVYNPWDALNIDQQVRDQLERATSYNVALAIRATLPGTEKQASNSLRQGQRVCRGMSWEVVVRDYLLPALRRTAQ